MPGFKDYVNGTPLLETDLDDLIAKQVVMKFASAAARDAALSGQLRAGMMAYLDSTNQLMKYNGSGWGAVGTVSFHPGTPNALTTSGTTLALCSQLTVPDQGVAGQLVVVATLLLTATASAGDTYDVTIRNTAASGVILGASRITIPGVGGASASYHPTARITMAAGAGLTVGLYAQRTAGTSTVTTAADTNYNTLNILFVPT